MKFHTNIPTLTFVATALLTAPLYATAAVPTAAQITEKWRSYFEALQKLPAWSYATRMQMWEKDPKSGATKARFVGDIKMSYARNGKQFRREIGIRQSQGAPYQVVTFAYNNRKYQMAVQTPEPTLIKGHRVRHVLLQSAQPFPDDRTLTTGFHLPLSMIFIFATKNINTLPFATLHRAGFWTTLPQRITKVVPATWEGHNGYSVTITEETDGAGDTHGETHVEVFIDGASGLPLRLKNVNTKVQKVIGEIKVTQLHAAQGEWPAFPLRVQVEGIGSAQAKTANPGGNGMVEVVPGSLTFGLVNADRGEADRFTIPFKSVEIVLENDKVIYLRLPKAPKKPPVKTPTKRRAKP